MDHDSTDHPEPPRKARRGSQPDLPPQDLIAADVDPATSAAEEDDESRLPEAAEDAGEEAAEAIAEGTLAVGHAAIENAVRLAPTSPGVYRMLNAASDVLYVGKAKNVRKRLSSYARVNAPLPARILRMIAATVTVEIVSTTDRDRSAAAGSQPDQAAAAALQRATARRQVVSLHTDIRRPLGAADPQASRRAIQARTIFRAVRIRRRRQPHHHGAAARLPDPLLHRRLLREPHPPLPALSDPPLLGPLHARDRLPRLYRAGARGDRFPVRPQPCREAAARRRDGEGVHELEFETAALYRDRLAALSAIQSQQGINPRTVEEADVFAIHQEGGYSCVEVFFFRTGQNWGNRAYFPKAEKSFTPEEVLASFLAQFYDDKPPPKLILLSHEIEESALLADALSVKAGFKVEVSTPKRGEKKELIAHALTNAREALGRKLSDTATQSRLLQGMATTLATAAGAEAHRGLRQQPHPGHQRRRRDDRGGAGWLHQEPVPQVQHQVRGTDARRRLRDDARGAGTALQAAVEAAGGRCRQETRPKADDDSFPQWPDLVIIDGGRGQLNAVREIFEGLGLTQVSLMAVAKARTAMPGGRPCSCRTAKPSSSNRAIRCCISSSGCATRRIAS
jgi:excinuclease ABC subunit C